MDHCIEPISGKQRSQGGAIPNVDLRQYRASCGDAPDAIQHRDLTVAQVVDDEDFVTRCHQFHRRVRTNVAGATCCEDCLLQWSTLRDSGKLSLIGLRQAFWAHGVSNALDTILILARKGSNVDGMRMMSSPVCYLLRG